MLKIYVACPLTKGDMTINVRNGILAGDELAKRGHVPFIPALTHFWHMLCPHEYEFWLEQDFEWVRVCDALFRVPGESKGADREVDLANSLGKPVYYRLDEVPTADTQCCPQCGALMFWDAPLKRWLCESWKTMEGGCKTW